MSSRYRSVTEAEHRRVPVSELEAKAQGAVMSAIIGGLTFRLRRVGEKWEVHPRGGISSEKLAAFPVAPAELRGRE